MTDWTRFLSYTEHGLFCHLGQFFIDPWKPVQHALITHAHADHARTGHQQYWVAAPGKGILAERVLSDVSTLEHAIQPIPYRQPRKCQGVWVSFYPAGHILGSAQILLEYAGKRLVISGDYKRSPDPTCEAFEPVPCDVFVTEATFALPIYQWPSMDSVMQDLFTWWQGNAAIGKTSVLFCYSLGKAQRVLMGIKPSLSQASCPFVTVHSAIDRLNTHYLAEGVDLPPTRLLADRHQTDDTLPMALVLAPPACQHNGWLKRFKSVSTGFASGWMMSRAARKQRQVDKGFIISDHVDWPGLLHTIEQTGASQVWVTHGRTDVLVRHLQENGMNAQSLRTVFGQDEDH
jgi:putative mRNA 3-end processing factor